MDARRHERERRSRSNCQWLATSIAGAPLLSDKSRHVLSINGVRTVPVETHWNARSIIRYAPTTPGLTHPAFTSHTYRRRDHRFK